MYTLISLGLKRYSGGFKERLPKSSENSSQKGEGKAADRKQLLLLSGSARSAPGILVHSETQTESRFHLKVCDSFRPPLWFLHTLGLRWAPLILVSVWGEGGSVISAL